MSIGDEIRKAIQDGNNARRSIPERRRLHAVDIRLEVNRILMDLPAKCKKAAAKGETIVEVMVINSEWNGGDENSLPEIERAVFRRLAQEHLNVFINYDMSGNWKTTHTLGLRIEG